MKEKITIIRKSIPQLFVMYLYCLGAFLLFLLDRFRGVFKK